MRMVLENTNNVVAALNFTYIIITSFIGIVALNFNNYTTLQYEKNKYISNLKSNLAISNLLAELNKINSINKISFSFFFAGWIIGYIYFNIIMIYIIKILVFMGDNNLDIFYFKINPDMGVSGKLIDAAYFNFAIFLLAIIWYFVYMRMKWNIVPEQSITWKSKIQLCALCSLAGAIVMSISLILIYVLFAIIPEYSASHVDICTIFLLPLLIGGCLVSFYCLKYSCEKIIAINNESKTRISEFYETGYPCVIISTTSKEITGKIKSILDKRVLIIIDKNKNTIVVPWNNIIFIKLIAS